MNKILIATGNKGKHKEMMNVFSQIPHLSFLSLRDFPDFPSPEETADNFQENALQKAQHYSHWGLPVLGEDSGIRLEAFPDRFGVRTRREIPHTDDLEWLRVFLEMMDGVENRRATFYSAVAFWDPQTQKSYTTIGSISGDITHFPQAPLEKGIPLSAVFIPEGETRVYSAMSSGEKAQISHRGQSTQKMVAFLQKNF